MVKSLSNQVRSLVNNLFKINVYSFLEKSVIYFRNGYPKFEQSLPKDFKKVNKAILRQSLFRMAILNLNKVFQNKQEEPICICYVDTLRLQEEAISCHNRTVISLLS